MPWERRWIPPSEDIEVLQELPEGAQVYGGGGWGSCQKAHLNGERWYYCKKPFEDSVIGCGGWIKGDPLREHEDTMGILCGRKGDVSHCRRCGQEVGFDGAIS